MLAAVAADFRVAAMRANQRERVDILWVALMRALMRVARLRLLQRWTRSATVQRLDRHVPAPSVRATFAVSQSTAGAASPPRAPPRHFAVNRMRACLVDAQIAHFLVAVAYVIVAALLAHVTSTLGVRAARDRFRIAHIRAPLCVAQALLHETSTHVKTTSVAVDLFTHAVPSVLSSQ